MAIQSDGFTITMTVKDNGKGTSIKKYNLDPAVVVDFAGAQLARNAIYDALSGVIQGVIVATKLSEGQFENAIVYPVSNIEIENKGSVSVAIQGSADTGNFEIPTVSPDIFVGLSGGAADQIDVTNAEVVAYADLFRHTTGVAFINRTQKIADSPNGNGIIVGKRVSSKNSNG